MSNNPAYIEIGSSYGTFYCDAHGLPCAGPDEPGTGTPHPGYGKAIAAAMNPPNAAAADTRMEQLVWFNVEEFRNFCALADGSDEEVGYVDILNVGYLWIDTLGQYHYEAPDLGYREDLFCSEGAPPEDIIPGSCVFFFSHRLDKAPTIVCGFVDSMNPETMEFTLEGWHDAFPKDQLHSSFASAMKAYRREKLATTTLKNHQESDDKVKE